MCLRLCVVIQSAVTSYIYIRRLDFPYKKKTKNSVQNIKNPNLTRTGILGTFPEQLGLTDWFISVPPSERYQLSPTDWFASVLPSQHCQLSGKFRTNSVSLIKSTRSVRNDSAIFVSDLVLPPQVAYELGLRRFLYQNQSFRRDAQLSC